MFRSPYPDVEIPDIPVTEYVLGQAGERGHRRALVDGATGRTLTYAQLAEVVATVAGGLARRGLEKGDVVAVCLPNIPEYAVAFHGVTSAGGIVAPMSPASAEEESAVQLKGTAARYLVTIPPLLPSARRAGGGVEEFFVLGEGEGATPFASLLEGAARRAEPEIDPHVDLAVLPTPAGRAGCPRRHAHPLQPVANGCQMLAAGHRPTDVDTLIGLVPFAHIFGMQAVMNLGLACGSTIATMARPDLAEFLRLVQDFGVTRAEVVPPIVHALARHPIVERYGLASLRWCCPAPRPCPHRCSALPPSEWAVS